ncbi:MAG: hypothetical protein EON59_08505 [Alphaproteobacteria bacterium]|nr:MAG: hypothetical protein EON59_08505 [Alphaproteobacteria bacterium]
MTRGGMAAHLAEGLARWDVQKHGAWEDAVAVASRRNGIVSQSSFTALAALQGLKSKRANEVGSDVRKALLRLRELSPDGKKRLIQPNIRMIRDSK